MHGTTTVETRITYTHPDLPSDENSWVFTHLPQESHLEHNTVATIIRQIVEAVTDKFDPRGDRDFVENQLQLGDFCDFLYNESRRVFEKRIFDETDDPAPYLLASKMDYTKDVLAAAFPNAKAQDRRSDIHSRSELIQLTLGTLQYIFDIMKHGVDYDDTYPTEKREVLPPGKDYITDFAINL